MTGKLIRLFLAEGKSSGLRTVEISNMTIYATIFPRTKLKEFSERESANKPGVYMLTGPDVDHSEETILYIGEGDPVLPRLKSHSNNKDFWTEAIVFTSKDSYLTKTQIQFLEAEIYGLAKSANRVILDNNQCPSKPNTSEVDIAEVQQFMSGINLILSSLNIDILEPRTNTGTSIIEKEPIFELTNKKAYARMSIIDDKYVVLKGSTAVIEDRPSARPHIKKLRRKLLESSIISENGLGLYVFNEDAAFDSPSYAAVAIVGGSANGQKVWKLNGRSLSEVEEDELK